MVAELCKRIQNETADLQDLCQNGEGSTPMAAQVSKSIATRLNMLKDAIGTALVDRVVDDFMDAGTPLKQFVEFVLQAHPDAELRDNIFEEKAGKLSEFSKRAVGTAKMVAVGTNTASKKTAEALLAQSAQVRFHFVPINMDTEFIFFSQVEALTPQLINAGRIRMVYPDNKAADEHFENLRLQFAEAVGRVRGLCDDATDTLSFVTQSLTAMEAKTQACEDAIKAGNALKMVENTSALGRLANRVIQIAKQEADNSEDPEYIEQMTDVAIALQNCKLTHKG